MCGWMQSVLCFTLDVLFHSAGVGRTGTFIAVDAMMQRLKERDDLDIYNFVTQMRTKRTFMVQNLVSGKTDCKLGFQLYVFNYFMWVGPEQAIT